MADANTRSGRRSGVRIATILGATVLAVFAFAYLGILVLLYAEQRSLLFIADNKPFGAVPPNYKAWTVHVPGGGPVLVWSIPPADIREPTFVFFTGNAARIIDFAGTGENFHSRGWGVVLASYRGYSGNPGSPSEDGFMQDARAILAALPAHGKLIVWGHSLGSGVAAQMASEHRADGLVLESAYTSIADVAAPRYPWFPVHWLIRDPFNTEALVNRIAVPVLLIHGTNDPVIPFAMSKTLAAELGTRATLIAVPRVGHVPHEIDLAPIVATWLVRTGLGP